MKKTTLTLALTVCILGLFSCKKSVSTGTNPTTPQADTLTITLQPGISDGQDCTVANREADNGQRASTNMNDLPNLIAARSSWNSFGIGEGSERAYIKFTGLSAIPQKAIIKSAKLSFYGVSSSTEISVGNSYYPGSGYNSFGSNKTWLKRVLSDWDQKTITWNNKPATSEDNKIDLPASTSQWNFDMTDIDVTQLVSDMLAANQNFGFCLQLQTEQIYRFLLFGSSESADATKRPKLVITYIVKKN